MIWFRLSLWRSNNVSFKNFLQWPIYIINLEDKTKLSCCIPHRRSTFSFRKLLPLFIGLKSALLSHTDEEELFQQNGDLKWGLPRSKDAYCWLTISNYWLRLSISWIISAEVRKPNSIIVFIKKTFLSEVAKAWEHYTSEGLGNMTAFELDICSRYWVISMGNIMSTSHTNVYWLNALALSEFS